EFREGTVRARLDARVARGQEQREGAGEGPFAHPRPADPARPGVPQEQVHAGRELLDARRRHRAAAVAPGLLRHRTVEERRAAAEVRRTHLLPSCVHRGADTLRKGDAQVAHTCRAEVPAHRMNALESTSTRPYLIRALYEWCTDNGFTPYVAVLVDDTVQ